jgi:hypothetical protein
MSTRKPPSGRPTFGETQRVAILRLLIDARGSWVPLPEILACAAQYNARIFELRRLGFAIENKTEEINGLRHSWFRLASSLAPQPVELKDPKPITDSADWYTRATGKPRPSGKSTGFGDLPLFAETHP